MQAPAAAAAAPHQHVLNCYYARICALSTCTAVVARISLRPGETPEQAQERRMRESQQVEERVATVSDLADWDRETSAAGDKLVVLEVRTGPVQLHMHASW